MELTQGAKSNTYDSIGNVDVSFRRNTIDSCILEAVRLKYWFNTIF